MQTRAKIQIIIPVFNEGPSLHRFHQELSGSVQSLPYDLVYTYIDDGSVDNSYSVLRELASSDKHVQFVRLTRNFGHQAALCAGLDAFSAAALVMMDGGGEHPPSLIPEMVRLWESGYDIVQTQRLDRGREGLVIKRWTSRVFYTLINRMGETKIVDGAADFRLMSQEAVRALQSLPEYHRFYRGMVQWIGFKTIVLPYVPAQRIAGKSKYSLRKMVRLAGHGIFSFSLMPLRLALLLGVAFLFLAAGELIYVLSFIISGQASSLVPGWSSLMVIITVSSGISMLLTGILGIYLGMIFQEVKRRPLYMIKAEAAGDSAFASEVSGVSAIASNQHRVAGSGGGTS